MATVETVAHVVITTADGDRVVVDLTAGEDYLLGRRPLGITLPLGSAHDGVILVEKRPSMSRRAILVRADTRGGVAFNIPDTSKLNWLLNGHALAKMGNEGWRSLTQADVLTCGSFTRMHFSPAGLLYTLPMYLPPASPKLGVCHSTPAGFISKGMATVVSYGLVVYEPSGSERVLVYRLCAQQPLTSRMFDVECRDDGAPAGTFQWLSTAGCEVSLLAARPPTQQWTGHWVRDYCPWCAHHGNGHCDGRVVCISAECPTECVVMWVQDDHAKTSDGARVSLAALPALLENFATDKDCLAEEGVSQGKEGEGEEGEGQEGDGEDGEDQEGEGEEGRCRRRPARRPAGRPKRPRAAKDPKAGWHALEK